MRIKIAVAAIVLLTATGIGVYFVALPKLMLSESEQKEAGARVKLAFASLTERLPKGKAVTPTKPFDDEAKKRWDDLDQRVAASHEWRAETLKALHEKTRRFFVESPEQGSFRRFRPSDDDILMDAWGNIGEGTQPGSPADFPNSPGENLERAKPETVAALHQDHQLRMLQFLYPMGFGYIKDRDHVAGFKPHGFRSFNGGNENNRYRVDHVLLVGILTQPEPVVYLTDGLPSMELIRQGKTRPLDFFEEAALPSLREGEDLYVVNKHETLRMLGAIRATKTCQKCHDAEIGDLLGAFSYTLRPALKEKE